MRSPRYLPSLRFFIAAIWIIGLAPTPHLLASEGCENWMARIVSAQGSVQTRRVTQTRWIDARLDDVLCPGDMLRVQENSRAAIQLRSEAIVRLDQNTAVTLADGKREGKLNLNILTGIALILSGFPFNLQILTPFVNANIEGTELLVQVGRTETTIIVYEGRVRAENEEGSLVIGRGESASATAGASPYLKTVVRPRDAVRWALYYPPISDRDLEDLTEGSAPWKQAVKRSLESFRKGDLADAFAHLRGVPPEMDDPALHAYLAVLHLTVGRFEEASRDLERAVVLRPDDGYAVSLQSIISLVQNRKEEAAGLARRAVELNPASAAPLIALSYVQQARFDLDGALSSVEKAADADPADGLVRARLAELWLSKGYPDRALHAAEEAAARTPELARTQTVLGYAYLTQIRIDESKDAFRKAIQRDQADPLPRLGLGLALIRDGELKAGRAEIEIAAMLDPDNSLVRSYLGKAYYEEKRDEKSAAELSKAKEMDPLDPTPWLYDAIRKQTVNRPAEALQDLQQSMARNDNRAVYRSRLLLDEDLAARSVSLARIYDDLGFQWLALNEGARSLERDPANFSAHRFLADSYFSLPRHEIARVSELLQSQLLQPINILPIQPQLAESRIFPLSGPGPRDPSFNEYTPLFTRNQLALLLGGLGGERGTFADDVVLSGILDRISCSLGQFHFQTNGSRRNNDQEQNIYNAFIQASLTPSTSLQGEYRYSDRHFGDLSLLFIPEFSDLEERQEVERETFRFGFRHSFAPGSDIIGSFMYQTLRGDFQSSVDALKSDQSGFGVELQHLFRSEKYNLVVGAGHFNRKQEDNISVFGLSLFSQFDTKHTDLYLYSHLNYPDQCVWSLGLSADFFKGGFRQIDVRQVNPKFGLAWTPFPGTTLRGAIFRTFKRTLLTEQTIEPTQVAGFNQFFDDGEGTDAWRFGLGLDQKLTDNLHAGVEISRRELSTPAQSISTGQVVEEDEEETLGRAYLYWTPHRWFAVGPEYRFELTKFGPALPAFGISRLETHRLGLGIGFFHPCGLLARLRPAWMTQDGEFRLNPSDPAVPGNSDFFVLDASIGYRLPRRWGLIEVSAKNLFDRSFDFQDTDPANPEVSPRRFIALKWMLSF